MRESRLKERQELPARSWVPRGRARWQRAGRRDPGRQTGVASDPDRATSQIRGCVALPNTESVSSQGHAGVGAPTSRGSGSLS